MLRKRFQAVWVNGSIEQTVRKTLSLCMYIYIYRSFVLRTALEGTENALFIGANGISLTLTMASGENYIYIYIYIYMSSISLCMYELFEY